MIRIVAEDGLYLINPEAIEAVVANKVSGRYDDAELRVSLKGGADLSLAFESKAKRRAAAALLGLVLGGSND